MSGNLVYLNILKKKGNSKEARLTLTMWFCQGLVIYKLIRRVRLKVTKYKEGHFLLWDEKREHWTHKLYKISSNHIIVLTISKAKRYPCKNKKLFLVRFGLVNWNKTQEW